MSIADGETDGHADRFWAAALCCTAAELGEATYEYRGAGSGRGGGMGPDDDDDRDRFRPPLGARLRGSIR